MEDRNVIRRIANIFDYYLDYHEDRLPSVTFDFITRKLAEVDQFQALPPDKKKSALGGLLKVIVGIASEPPFDRGLNKLILEDLVQDIRAMAGEKVIL